MNSGMRFDLPNPTHMTLDGVWIHRCISGLEHVPDAGCWCVPLFITAQEMNNGGPEYERLVAFNWRH